MKYITIALAKGRISEKSINLLEKSGFNCDELKSDSRKLIFIDNTNLIKYILVKPQDVPIYVEYGSADIGIVGKDVLLEEARDLYEPLDLCFGKCAMVVAGLNNTPFTLGKTYKVASKYPTIAFKFFSTLGIDIKIIKLSGSVELAPIIGLSDLIVDIVETGETLRENGLDIKQIITDISARMVVNKASMKIENKRIIEMIEKLEKGKKELGLC